MRVAEVAFSCSVARREEEVISWRRRTLYSFYKLPPPRGTTSSVSYALHACCRHIKCTAEMRRFPRSRRAGMATSGPGGLGEDRSRAPSLVREIFLASQRKLGIAEVNSKTVHQAGFLSLSRFSGGRAHRYSGAKGLTELLKCVNAPWLQTNHNLFSPTTTLQSARFYHVHPHTTYSRYVYVFPSYLSLGRIFLPREGKSSDRLGQPGPVCAAGRKRRFWLHGE